MMEYESTGRTVEEATEKALDYLGIRKENALVTVLDEPSQGLLGLLGSKTARVAIKALKRPEEYLFDYLMEMLENMGIEGSVAITQDDEKMTAMVMGDDVGILIGRRGKTLSDLQYIINIVMRRQFNTLNKMIVIDVENYRARREKTLTQLAINVAKRVCEEGYEKALEPMTPQERRIIHIALQNYPGVTTYSSGQEPYRKVVVAPH